MDWFLYDSGLRRERVNYVNLPLLPISRVINRFFSFFMVMTGAMVQRKITDFITTKTRKCIM